MPLVQVMFPTDATKERSAVVRMATPRKMGEILIWFRDARKVAPQIPDPKHGNWRFVKMESDLREVRFLLQDSVNQQCLVVIDRQTRI